MKVNYFFNLKLFLFKDVGCSIEIPEGMQVVEDTIQGVQIIRAKKIYQKDL